MFHWTWIRGSDAVLYLDASKSPLCEKQHWFRGAWGGWWYDFFPSASDCISLPLFLPVLSAYISPPCCFHFCSSGLWPTADTRGGTEKGLIRQHEPVSYLWPLLVYALYIVHICTFKIMYIQMMWVNEVFLDRQMTILHFFCIFCQFWWSFTFLLIMNMFFWRIPAYSTYLKYDIAFVCIFWHCFIVHGKICLQFTCIFCIFAVPYTWKTRDGRKMHQIFCFF